MAVLRHETSTKLRRRQYALLLSYFQYCQHMLEPDIPATVLQFLFANGQDNDLDLQKNGKEQAELARSNFAILRKEAQPLLDLVIKDATQGGESGKITLLYILDALICIDHDKFFLSQLQSRGFLRSCFMSIDVLMHQVIYSLLFSLVIAFVSDALSAVPDKVSVLSRDPSFRNDFQKTVIVIGNDPIIEAFVVCVRLAWIVHMMLTQDGFDVNDTSSNHVQYLCSCLDTIFSNNVFQFWLDNILKTAAFQHDDEDMIYMYNAYLHKMVTCFLSHPLARDKHKGRKFFKLTCSIWNYLWVKETKEKTMNALGAYRQVGSNDPVVDGSSHSNHSTETTSQPFVSLLEFVSGIYQKEPELLSRNDVLWTFVNFAGEDHINFQTLVAFLNMLSTLASSPEGASKSWSFVARVRKEMQKLLLHI